MQLDEANRPWAHAPDDDRAVEAYLREKAAQDRAMDERTAQGCPGRRKRRASAGRPAAPLSYEEFVRRGLAEFRLKLQRADEIRKIGEAGRKP